MFCGCFKVDKLGRRFNDASENGDVEAMKKILKGGLDPNKPCSELMWFPLHCAAFQGQLEVVKILVEDKGCDINMRNGQQETPLRLAVLYNRANTVKYLLEKGANPWLGDWVGRNSIEAANRAHNSECKKILEEALAKAAAGAPEQHVGASGDKEVQKEKEKKKKPCKVCSAASRHRCGQCKSASYCSRECQRRDWQSHKAICQPQEVERNDQKSSFAVM